MPKPNPDEIRWYKRHTGKNRHQKRAQYASVSRSYPYAVSKFGSETRRLKAESIKCGRYKIFKFIERGIRLNSRPNFMKRIVQGVQEAIYKG